MRERFVTRWQFRKAAPDTPYEAIRGDGWQAVSLPHDWLISQENDLYETGDGWYRRTLTVPGGETADTWRLRFDGVYMDCDVAVNGETVCTHRYGYTAFEADLTGKVKAGDNEITVLIRHRSPNSRWYSGAGIFREVTLLHFAGAHLVSDGVYAVARRAEGAMWRLDVTAEVSGPDGTPVSFELDDLGGAPVAKMSAIAADGTAAASADVLSPRRWSPEEPNLYRLTVRAGEDSLTCSIGFRETLFDPERGFVLNGEPVKLKGVCLHHDLGLFGSAFHPKAARRQLRLMKDMGANAVRTTHNPPASAFLDLCDEMGLLVIDEAFDMWRLPKTTYDYARFFDACVEEDVASWVRRDRNHPCVIMWSVGNEIYDTFGDPKAPDITRMLKENAEKHDPRHNASATIGSNYMPWEGAQKCADVLKLAGYNYGEKLYARHHAEHPDWVIYGSETASLVFSRGVYHFPITASILADEDLQCSALGNSNTSWGATDLGAMIADDLNTPWSMGQFIWSGIDYIGEPTPYHTRNSYFGQADTACFPKDAYYRFQAAWVDRPMAHIGVCWDWNEGQLIDVPVMTSLPTAELFLNGVSLGAKHVDVRNAADSVAVWRVPFAPGVLQARCYDAEGHMKAQDMKMTPGEPARLTLSCGEDTLLADGEDVAFITVGCADVQGLPVENANSRVRIEVSGPAHLIGVDNGDSTDPDGYRQDTRRLFSGKLLAVAGMATEPGEVTVTAFCEGLAPARLTLSALPAERVTDTVPPVIRRATEEKPTEVRCIRLQAQGSTALSPEHPAVEIRTEILPAAASEQPIRYRMVNAQGIESPAALIEEIPGGVRVTGAGDGHVYLRATAANGESHARVISQLDMDLTGFGKASLDPYGFVTAGLYDLHEGDIGAGNEQGIAFARDGESMVGFSNVDFGPVGSDEITIPVFALNDDAYDIRLWQGDPRKGGEKLAVLTYKMPYIWNVYQEQTFRLPRRLTGLQTLCFSLDRKVHLKGFRFTRQSRAWLTNRAAGADEIYGDDFVRGEEAVTGIGNNVSLLFGNMDFGEGGPVRLTLRGSTQNPVCSVNVRITDAAGAQTTQMCSFTREGGAEQTFALTAPEGVCTVAFIFLPGARFDFETFRFERL